MTQEAARSSNKFYEILPSFRQGRLGFWIENVSRLLCGRAVLCPPIGRRGFSVFPEPPLLVIDTRKGRVPADLEAYCAYWLISGRLKQVLETVDPEGCAFVKCDVRGPEEGSEQDYWLCDLLRVLDAVDEDLSCVGIGHYSNEEKYYRLAGASLVFKQQITKDAHIFRLAFMKPAVFCDRHLRAACRKASLKGLLFRDASKL